jgi:hypothetical protein
MQRKKWSANTLVTPELLKIRDKKKWQIALRRYLIDKNPSINYAPYFGLDILQFRKWMEIQFDHESTWENFGKKWQIDHIIPISYFNFSEEKDLKLCWNYLNIKVGLIATEQKSSTTPTLSNAKKYFTALLKNTELATCITFLKKIEEIEERNTTDTTKQVNFINQQKNYLTHIANYTTFEFELLNNNRTIESIQTEIEFLKKI